MPYGFMLIIGGSILYWFAFETQCTARVIPWSLIRFNAHGPQQKPFGAGHRFDQKALVTRTLLQWFRN
uniref:Putative secreted protein n=1 Tax=Anopheles marajoara TaxID=58244 RepID=A0A2M4CGD7_9DIPT